MNLHEIVGAIPELFLLVIPGYIALKIKQGYSLEKQMNTLDIILYSIVYSFIVQIAFSSISLIASRIGFLRFEWPNRELIRQISYLLLSVILGYVLVKVPKTMLGIFISKLFNKNLAPFSSVWIKAMKNDDGAWATVYLKNGLIYTGMLINYTTDPNEQTKEILLTSYRLCVQNTGADITPEKFFTVIVDHTDNPDSKVLLERSDILSIEIIQ